MSLEFIVKSLTSSTAHAYGMFDRGLLTEGMIADINAIPRYSVLNLNDHQQWVMGLNDPGAGPLTVPIWYDYSPGGQLWVITGKQSRKSKLLEVGCV
jgi:hypothetical protein